MKKDMKMKKGKMILKIILIVLAVLIVFTAAVYINHITLLKKEEALLAPLGQLAEVEGNKMSVYIEGREIPRLFLCRAAALVRLYLISERCIHV